MYIRPMAFADKVWASTITALTIDLESSSIHLVTKSHESAGGGTHLLSLLGVRDLAVRATLPDEKVCLEVMDFGVRPAASGELEVVINVCDATGLEVRCSTAVFDGDTFAAEKSRAG